MLLLLNVNRKVLLTTTHSQTLEHLTIEQKSQYRDDTYVAMAVDRLVGNDDSKATAFSPPTACHIKKNTILFSYRSSLLLTKSPDGKAKLGILE